MSEEVFTCGRCGQPLSETAVFNPRGNTSKPFKPSYMHVKCAEQESAEMKAEITERTRKLNEAAPMMLSALKKILDETTATFMVDEKLKSAKYACDPALRKMIATTAAAAINKAEAA